MFHQGDIRCFHHHAPSIDESCYIDSSAVIIGQVSLLAGVSVWPLVVIRSDVNHIKIGARSNIQDGSVLHVSRPTPTTPAGYPLLIGEDVTIAHKVMLHGCTIHDRVLVGMSSIVMDGAVVESDVIIGAGSLVPPGKHLAAGYLYMGSPVRQVRPLTPDECSGLRRSAENYVKLRAAYL